MTQNPMNDSMIFREAIKLQPEQRTAFLDKACGANQALRNEVESLLRAHDPADSFLQLAALAHTIQQPIREGAGSTIGPYKLREKIGEGGFGVVYVAEQETPVRRKVAMKIVKPGMDTLEVIARFEAEQQALAMMDHPNVARVLDAGTTGSGLPYFVMELVQGVTITDFCDKNSLDTRDRLKLFADVCRAVQHAHQKGIIHRDIKPSNIMVTLHDGKPVVKVIDFGIAKALNQQLTEKSIYTAYGQMIGTPSYMSPEQAEMSGLGIDTRSDIYSLGVLLYELLTGVTPVDVKRLRSSAYAEMLRIIREEEPARPSDKVSTLGEQATIVAKHRHTDPQQLRRDLSGELDWIVMRCLEKERGRRYDTANGLARDIERYLADETVEACPPSFRYRIGKTIRRNRGPVLAASLLFVTLSAGIVGTTWGLLRANKESARARDSAALAIAEARKAKEAAAEELVQRQRADSEAAASKAVRNFLQEDLLRQSSIIHQAETIGPNGKSGEFLHDPTIKQLLDRAAIELAPDKIESKLTNNTFVQAEVLKAVGDAYLGVAPREALEPLNRAIGLYEHALGHEHPSTLSARHSLGIALDAVGRSKEAATCLESVLQARSRVLRLWHVDTVSTRDYFGRTLLSTDVKRAVDFFEQFSRDAVLQLGAEHNQTGKARYHLAYALREAGRINEGLRILEELSSTVDKSELAMGHPYYVALESELGAMYRQAKRHQEAVTHFENALKSPAAMSQHIMGVRKSIRHQLGFSYLEIGQTDDAIATFEQNVEESQPGIHMAMSLQALAKALQKKDVDRSIEIHEKARQMRNEFRDGKHVFTQPYALGAAKNYATFLSDANRHSEAVERLNEIIDFLEDNPQTTGVKRIEMLALRLRSLAKVDGAPNLDDEYEKLVTQLQQQQDPSFLDRLSEWMLYHEGRESLDRAAVIANRMVDEYRRLSAKVDSRKYAGALFACGRILVKAGRAVDALPFLTEVMEFYEAKLPNEWLTADCRSWLGCALADQAVQPDAELEAEQLLKKSFDELNQKLSKTPAWGQQRRYQVAERLATFYRSKGKEKEANEWQQQAERLRPESSAP